MPVPSFDGAGIFVLTSYITYTPLSLPFFTPLLHSTYTPLFINIYRCALRKRYAVGFVEGFEVHLLVEADA